MAPRPRAQSGDRAPLSAHTKAVAATLNGERGASGLTYEQLADKSGVNVRSLKRYISPKGDRDMPLDVLRRLAVALNISYAEIFRRAEMRLQVPAEAPRDQGHESAG